jgi:hypothetical protein
MRLIAMLVIFAVMSSTRAGASAPGAYATPAAPSASDCIKLCQDDSLCVGWTYEAGACGLWASVPKDAPLHFTLSEHAPAFAHEMEVAQAGDEPTAGSAPAAGGQHETAALALLGGDDGRDDIRPRLGGD